VKTLFWGHKNKACHQRQWHHASLFKVSLCGSVKIRRRRIWRWSSPWGLGERKQKFFVCCIRQRCNLVDCTGFSNLCVINHREGKENGSGQAYFPFLQTCVTVSEKITNENIHCAFFLRNISYLLLDERQLSFYESTFYVLQCSLYIIRCNFGVQESCPNSLNALINILTIC